VQHLRKGQIRVLSAVFGHVGHPGIS
jgi:hypothetical protein